MIDGGLDDPEFERFEKTFNDNDFRKKNGDDIQNVWILKPGENTNRGSGIIVSNDFTEIK